MNINKIGFLSYLSRSGSTFLSRLLNEYEEICVTLEADFPPEMLGIKNYNYIKFDSDEQLKSYIQFLFKHTKLNSWKLDRDNIQENLLIGKRVNNSPELFSKLLDLYRQKYKPNSKLIIYKGVPVVPWELPNLNRRFPDSEKIYLIRDPRAIYNSSKDITFPNTKRKFAFSPFQIAEYWAKSYKILDNKNIKNLRLIKYEDLVENSRFIVEDLLEKINISTKREKSNTDYEYFNLIPEKEKEYHSLVNKDAVKDRVSAWKSNLSQIDIYIIEKYLSKELTSSAYDITARESNRLKFLYHLNFIYYKVYYKSRRMYDIFSRACKNPYMVLNKIILKINEEN